MNDFPFLCDSQIEELEQFGMMELTEEMCEAMNDYYSPWDDDQALEEYSLECAFGPND
jgi:hypothetical protein